MINFLLGFIFGFTTLFVYLTVTGMATIYAHTEAEKNRLNLEKLLKDK